MPPLKTPKELAAERASSKLSDPALLVEFGDADYDEGTGGELGPEAVRSKKGDNAARVWSSATARHQHGAWRRQFVRHLPTRYRRDLRGGQARGGHPAAAHARAWRAAATRTSLDARRRAGARPLAHARLRRDTMGQGRPATVTCQGGALNGDALMACSRRTASASPSARTRARIGATGAAGRPRRVRAHDGALDRARSSRAPSCWRAARSSRRRSRRTRRRARAGAARTLAPSSRSRSSCTRLARAAASCSRSAST